MLDDSVRTRLRGLEDELRAIESRLAEPDIYSDQKAFRDLSRRQKELSPIVAASQSYEQAASDLSTAKEMLGDTSGDDRDMLLEEIDGAEQTIARLTDELKVLLLPRDPNDDKNVIVEIRGAEGGEEANLFAKDLYEMYARYAERMRWKLSVMEADASPMGGVNQVIFGLSGEGVWSRMKHEGGVHRVQRVPVTEAQGRIHTSSATVTVLPEAEEVDVEIHENDLQIDVYRSGGPGGQSVNTTDSAVRITHKPTGIVVAMQDEKSQLQNKAKAMVVLRSRILKAEQDRQQAELSDSRRSQIGAGGRADKIRTYNFKENRITDHRIGLTVYNLSKVLAEGVLDEITDALMADERARQLAGEGAA